MNPNTRACVAYVAGKASTGSVSSNVSVDSAWLSFSSSPKNRKAARELAELKSPWAKKVIQERHVNIVADRATFVDRTARLDQFLHTSGVGPDERVTVISDDAGEFEKAVQCSELARGRILDWFHIAMKFKAAENSIFGSATIGKRSINRVPCAARSDVIGVGGVFAQTQPGGSPMFQGSSAS